MTAEKVLFLQRLYEILNYAPLEDLITIAKEDEAWRSVSYGQRMDSLGEASVYEKQYGDVLEEIME